MRTGDGRAARAAWLLGAILGLAGLVGCQGAADVSGRVTDPVQKGAGVGEVIVVATPIPVGDVAPGPAIAATSAADGSFSLPGMVRGASYRVGCERAGYVCKGLASYTVGKQGAAPPVRLVASELRRFNGEVVDPVANAPVAGAQVIAVARAGEATAPEYERLDALTRSDGGFTLETPLPLSSYEITASKRGYTKTTVTPDESTGGRMPALEINPLPTVTGRTVNPTTGTPVPGCTVKLDLRTVTTDLEGSFSFDKVPQGEHKIELACGGTTQVVTFTVEGGKKEVSIGDATVVLLPPSPTDTWAIREGLPYSLPSIALPSHLAVRISNCDAVLASVEALDRTQRLEAAQVDAVLGTTVPMPRGSELVSMMRPGTELMALPLVRYGPRPLASLEKGDGMLAPGYYPAMTKLGPAVGGRSSGQPVKHCTTYPLAAKRTFSMGGDKYGLVGLELPAGAYCIARIPTGADRDRFRAKAGCGLVVIPGKAGMGSPVAVPATPLPGTEPTAQPSAIEPAGTKPKPGETGEQPIVFQARLSRRDHFNSRGIKLPNAAEIVRQDRANFHNFNIRDSEDTADPSFGQRSERDRLVRLIRDRIDPRSARRIMRGTPLVEVRVWRDRALLRVLSD